MKKILFIAPHLSTGGLPQVLVNKLELLKDEYQIYCVEWSWHGDAFVDKCKIYGRDGYWSLVNFDKLR